jgi:molybdenum cofactor cytidylyltransferase
LDGKPLIRHVFDAVAASRVDEVIVVTGGHHDEVAASVGDGVKFVRNPDPTRGMLSSVRCGLEAIDADTNAIAIFLGDQPRLQSAVIDAVLTAFAQSSRSIAVPVMNGKRGHPLVFAAAYRDEILNSFDEVGLRGLLLANPDEVCEVPVESPAVLEDVDTPEDFEKLAG